MSFRISPVWWPLLAVTAPVTGPWLFARNRRFREERNRVSRLNRERIDGAGSLQLPELDYLELTVLVEWKANEGFLGDPGVSYLLKTDLGTMLYDVGFGPTRPTLAYNAAKLGVQFAQIEALVISHLHNDHMGGFAAQRTRQVTVPAELLVAEPKPCFLPDQALAKELSVVIVNRPKLLTAGIASTGPLARSLFMFGLTEEQALVARIKGKGLMVLTGCGHPTIEVVLEMVNRLSCEPIYAIGGGLHFPVTGGRGSRAGIELQTIFGTGKPPWQRITDEDLSQTIDAINRVKPQRVYLSGHDSCDHSLERMMKELRAETDVLKAGSTYRF